MSFYCSFILKQALNNMHIKSINRPWIKEGQRRYNRDPFYTSQTWVNVKKSFKLDCTTLPDGRSVSNTLCLECFKAGKIKNGHSIDHIIRIKDGGSRTDFSNLQNLCESCHNRKSAHEGNANR